MAKLYKRSDRVTIRIDDIIIKLAPLSFEQKTEIQDMMARGHIKKDYKLLQEAVSASIKYSLKALDGVEDADGKPYSLSFDETGCLTDDCIDDIYNLEMHPKLVMVCATLVRNIPSSFVDDDGKPLEGVEIISNKKEEPADPN